MRRGLLLGAATGVVDAVVVLLLDWALRDRGDVGWVSYSPMPARYADYLRPRHVVNGWAAVAVVLAALVVVNMVLVAAYVLLRRRRVSRHVV